MTKAERYPYKPYLHSGCKARRCSPGHLDLTRGPAVFYRLGTLRPGDQVIVVRRDATHASFTVNQIGEYPKDRFPTHRVYGPTRQAALRLVTCGGPFSRRTGHYQDNVIVYAVRSP